MSELTDEPFIALPLGSPFRLAVDNLFHGVGLQPRVVAEVRTQRAICKMVAAKAGVSILDSSVARDYAPDHLAVIKIDPPLRWTVVAVTPLRTTPSQATKALLSALAKSLSRRRRDG